MLSSEDFGQTRETSDESQSTLRFSFPPTQKTSLLDRPAPRSQDQTINLQRSLARLLGALEFQQKPGM